MNRRGFIALATAAAVAPQELIAAPAEAPVLDAAAIGSAYTKALAKSLLSTKEMVGVKFIAPSAFLMELQKMLNEEFSGLYECIPYEEIFQDPEALASEERGRDRTAGKVSWEDSERTTEAGESESRGAGGLYSPARAG